MFIKQSIKKKNILILLSNIVIIIMILIPILYEVLVHDAYFFYIFIVLYIYLPGRLALRFLKPESINIDKIIMFLLNFYIGCSLIFIEYFIFYYFNIMYMIRILNVLLSIVEIVLILYNYYTDIKRLKFGAIISKMKSYNTMILLLMVFVTFFMCMLANNYKFPFINSTMNPDRPYQISNLVGLTTREPFKSMTVYGSEFKYHYFNYLFGAICKIVFNIPGFYFINYYMPLYVPVLMVLSIYALFKKVFDDKFIILAMYFTCYFNMLSDTSTHYFLHVSSNTNAMGFAIPCFILCIIVVYDFTEYNSFVKTSDFVRQNIIMMLLTFVLTGIKGPAGLVLAVSFFAYVLFYKVNKKYVLLATMILITFSLSYFFIISSSNLNNGNTFSFFSSMYFPNQLKEINNKVIKFILICLYSLPSLVSCYNIFIFPSIIMIVVLLASVFNKNGLMLFYTIITWCSIILGFLLKFPGRSELYFLILTTPIVASIAIYFYKLYNNTIHVYVFLILMLLAYLPGNIFRMYTATNYNYNNGFLASFKDVSNYYFGNKALENKVFDGYKFISDHTPKDSIIATNKLNYENYIDDFRSHDLAAFGERHVFLEGYQYAGINSGYANLNNDIKYNNLIFSKISGNEKNRLLKKLGIDYVFLYKGYDGYFSQDANALVVFENDDVVIFNIK